MLDLDELTWKQSIPKQHHPRVAFLDSLLRKLKVPLMMDFLRLYFTSDHGTIGAVFSSENRFLTKSSLRKEYDLQIRSITVRDRHCGELHTAIEYDGS